MGFELGEGNEVRQREHVFESAPNLLGEQRSCLADNGIDAGAALEFIDG